MTCRICEKQFDEIPIGTIEIHRPYGTVMYRFPDGQIHEFKLGKPRASQKKTEGQKV